MGTGYDEDSSKHFFIWSEEEVNAKHVSQVGVSACGATAALNVLNFFNIPVDTEKAVKAVKTRLRNTTAPLPEYLKSRSIAGTTHDGIIDGINSLTNGKIRGRFFAFYPQRRIDMHQWLLNWFIKGAVPIATLNLQREPAGDSRIADAWHHQMIFGVTEKGVHLSNPIKMMLFREIENVLCSDAILKIRLEDVALRYNPGMDLSSLIDPQDERWSSLNVVDEIVKLYNKVCSLSQRDEGDLLQLLKTEYLTIPAAYESGITLFMDVDSEYYTDLVNADELPFES